jgi:hypothetical protein
LLLVTSSWLGENARAFSSPAFDRPIGGNQVRVSNFSKTKSLAHPLIKNSQRPTSGSLLLNARVWYLAAVVFWQPLRLFGILLQLLAKVSIWFFIKKRVVK